MGNRKSKTKEEPEDTKGKSEVENQRRTGGYKGMIGNRKPRKSRRIQRGNEKWKTEAEQGNTKGYSEVKNQRRTGG